MKYFSVAELFIPGVKLLNLIPQSDSRGQLLRVYDEGEFTISNLQFNPKQINIVSTTVKGTVRGLHLQSNPYPEAKIVKCMKGEAFDVILDLRKDSPTFGMHSTFFLNARNPFALLIPSGCAHGMQSLTEDAELMYLHDCDYIPSAQLGINPMDTEIGVDWPLPVSLISERDKTLPQLRDWK
jgi:dTDP-4-dehydrorhamnose 3,5-epimerase